MLQKVIAIDGPSASGKGTIAAQVAQQLNYAYLDSGALYRLTALYAQLKNISWEDETQLAQLAAQLPVAFQDKQILLEQTDVSKQIRTEHIGLGASKIATLPKVRQALLQRQRDFLGTQGLVADGRDMGSTVFPHAQLKIFLTASSQIRAERRAKQIGVALDSPDFQQILNDIEQRDYNDRNRTHAPLQQLPDARLLDTSHLTIEETVKKVIDWYHEIAN